MKNVKTIKCTDTAGVAEWLVRFGALSLVVSRLWKDSKQRRKTFAVHKSSDKYGPKTKMPWGPKWCNGQAFL